MSEKTIIIGVDVGHLRIETERPAHFDRDEARPIAVSGFGDGGAVTLTEVNCESDMPNLLL